MPFLKCTTSVFCNLLLILINAFASVYGLNVSWCLKLISFFDCSFHNNFLTFRNEEKLTELENQFSSLNPEIVKRIRFGKKEESEQLVAEVDEIGKRCKKLAKVRRTLMSSCPFLTMLFMYLKPIYFTTVKLSKIVCSKKCSASQSYIIMVS